MDWQLLFGILGLIGFMFVTFIVIYVIYNTIKLKEPIDFDAK
jgi:hypothetical protein